MVVGVASGVAGGARGRGVVRSATGKGLLGEAARAVIGVCKEEKMSQSQSEQQR